MRWLLLLLLPGCAALARTDHLTLEAGFLYSRITDCTAQDIPPPLIPDKDVRVPDHRLTVEEGKMSVQGDTTHCTTLEVGAKSYSDTISAIGTAAAIIFAHIYGVF